MAGRARKATARSIGTFWRDRIEDVRVAQKDLDLLHALYICWLEDKATKHPSLSAMSEKARNIWLSKRAPDWIEFNEGVRLAVESLAFEGIISTTSPQRGGVQGDDEQVRARNVVARDVPRAREAEGGSA